MDGTVICTHLVTLNSEFINTFELNFLCKLDEPFSFKFYFVLVLFIDFIFLHTNMSSPCVHSCDRVNVVYLVIF